MGKCSFRFSLLFRGFSKSSNLNENLYGHFLYTSYRPEIAVIKPEGFCTNTIKYRNQSIDVIWGTNINNTVPFE